MEITHIWFVNAQMLIFLTLFQIKRDQLQPQVRRQHLLLHRGHDQLGQRRARGGTWPRPMAPGGPRRAQPCP